LKLEDVTVYTVNEYLSSEEDLELALKVPSDLLIRAWFKWANVRDFKKDAWVIPKVREKDVLFGGGVTVAALYKGENGITEEEFDDMVTRDPTNRPFPAFARTNYYHGALGNQRYLDYVLSWVYKQMDVVVDVFFMDEAHGAYSVYEGFDDHSLEGFRDWLVKKYCEGQSWKIDDPRWTTHFSIPLDDREICPDGTIRSLDYRAYVVSSTLADPSSQKNPLAKEWGYTRDFSGTYCAERRKWSWKYLCDKIREYAASKGRTVYINDNGLNHHVDLQIQWMSRHEWKLVGERIDCSVPFMSRWRGVVLGGWSMAGKRVPVVFFHDWGFGMPWMSLNTADKINWLRIYGPEIYAAGGFFALPVRGPFGCDCGKDGTLDTIIKLASFFKKNSQLFHGNWSLNWRNVKVGTPKINVMYYSIPKIMSRALHMINHNYADNKIQPQEDVQVMVPSSVQPKSLTLISPDLHGEKDSQSKWKDGWVTFTVPRLESYIVALIKYDELPSEKTEPGGRNVLLECCGFFDRPRVDRFIVEKNGHVENSDQICAFIQGRKYPHLRNNPTFELNCGHPVKLTVHLNSVAEAGANLIIYLDGEPVVNRELFDTDRRQDRIPMDGFTDEYDEDITFNVPIGRHTIKVDNLGPDWLTISFYEISDYIQE